MFGAKTSLRAEKAIELYQQGWSRKVIFSGHGSYTNRDSLPEAERGYAFARQAGIPDEDIIVENRSITIPDNVRTSLNLFDRLNFKPTRLILVNSPYSQRRGWCLFQKYLCEDVSVIRHNCQTTTPFSQDRWFQHKTGLEIVLNEFIKMKIAVTLNTA